MSTWLHHTISILFFLLLSCISLLAQKVGTFLHDPSVDLQAITWSITGKIYVLDFHAGDIYRVEADTLKKIGSGYGTVAGGGVDIQGNFYFSAHNKGEIYRVNYDDSIDFFAGGFSGPVGILLSFNTEIFFVTDFDINGIRKLTLSTGEVSEYVSMQGIRGPDGIVRMKNGDLLVSNFTNNRIHRIDNNDNIHYFASHSQDGNMGYIASAGDYFYVPSVRGNSIDRFDQLGNRIQFAGNGKLGSVDGNASKSQFSHPRGITSNPAGDTLLITENGGKIRYITELLPKPIIDEQDAEAGFSIYPNPTLSYLNIEYICEEVCQTVQMEICNNLGRVIERKRFTTTNNEVFETLEITHLPPNIYYLQIIEATGDRQMRKFVKLND